MVETFGIIVEVRFCVVVFCGETDGKSIRIVAIGGGFTKGTIVKRRCDHASFVPIAHDIAVVVVPGDVDLASGGVGNGDVEETAYPCCPAARAGEVVAPVVLNHVG